MNIFLKEFIDNKFKERGKALDLGAGNFVDVEALIEMGWDCEGVDIKNGVDLELPFKSSKAPFDLVFSNFLLHKIKNKDQFIKTVLDNLKKEGWLFVQSLDESDLIARSDLNVNEIKKLLESDFKNISIKIFDLYDETHKHWHVVLEFFAQKR